MTERFDKVIKAIDAYNAVDPHQEQWQGKSYPKELLYSIRMSDCLQEFHPDAPEHVQLAVRCQHIGRWEVPRDAYTMDKKGYFQWRNTLKDHHALLAEKIMLEAGYELEEIDRVKSLLHKKHLGKNEETQLLEDVVCLVFIRYYLDDFAIKHEDDKVIDILRKTMMKMSPEAIRVAGTIAVSERATNLIAKAAG